MPTAQNNHLVRTEFAAAISQIMEERKIEAEDIYEAIRQALVSAYRKQIGELDENSYYYVQLNKENGSARIFKAPVTKRDEETEEILAWDESKSEDVTPAGFGRIAAQTAKQVVLQKIRRSERDTVIAAYRDQIGELVTAKVLRMQARNVIMDIGRGQGFMPPEDQMRGEFYRLNQRLAVLIKEIRETSKGEQVIVSRSDADLVKKLFEREVPEVSSGTVEIVAIAREAGVRTKLTVRSRQEGADPVGSCVGQRGVRVQKVIEELNNEKVDIIPFTENQVALLQGALAPAENLKVDLDEDKKLAIVTAPDDQLSLLIGRGGQNVRLAAKLTGYQIKVKSADGALQSEVTGKEEYEIDTFEGLDNDTREILIQHKLTTVGDLIRFREKWQIMADIADAQMSILQKKVDESLEQEREKAEQRAAAAKIEAEVTSTEETNTELANTEEKNTEETVSA